MDPQKATRHDGGAKLPNDLTYEECLKLDAIRQLTKHDLPAAKKMASKWMLANKRRRQVRQNWSRTIGRLYSA